MRPLRSSPLPVVAAAALVATAGACGTGSQSSPASAGADFPLTLTREGGVAGFSDRVLVDKDGRVTAEGASGGSPCTLAESAVRDLTALARPLTGAATTTPAHPDDLVVVLGSPHGSARLTDTQLSGPAALVTRLFDDLAKPPSERTLCR